MTTVSTHLMFQEGKAQAALDLYASVFSGFKVVSVEKYGTNDGTPGLVKIAEVDFSGQQLVVIDSPIRHEFDFTPSVSLFVNFDGAVDLDRAFEELVVGGEVKMPLDDYGFSQRFGWLTDRFGMSWQLNLPKTK
ncbi:MAG: VOC family protein [Hyphomicrobiaceae bacterium]